MSAPRHLWSGDWRRESEEAAERLADRRADLQAPAQRPAERGPGPSAPAQRTAERPPQIRLSGEAGPTSLRPAHESRLSAPGSRDPARMRASAQARGIALLEAAGRGLQAATQWSRATRQRAARSVTARRRMRGLRKAPRPTHQPHYRRIVVAGLLLTLVSAAAAYGVVSLLVSSGGRATASSKGPPWLGVDMASSVFGNGAMVVDVIPGSPAGEAGIEPGDVITQVNSRPVASPNQFNSAISRLHVGEQIELQVLRGPLTFTTHATLVTRPAGSP